MVPARVTDESVLREEAPAPRIAPLNTGLWWHVRQLYAYRELLWMWGLREIRVRYKQSILGAAWAILQPLVLMLVFTVVFSHFVRVPTEGVPYPIFSYTALLPWTFLATSISFAVPSLINNAQLVTKIYFPREILPLGSIIASFLDFLLASVVFAGLMLYYQTPLKLHLLWLPLLLVIQVALTAGIVFYLAALTVRFRDFRFVVPLGIQIWLYASPILYPVSLVPDRFRFVYMLNPMAGLVDSYRKVVLSGMNPSTQDVVISAAVSLLLLAGGFSFFKKSESAFADTI